jgi:hypothetical protein
MNEIASAIDREAVEAMNASTATGIATPSMDACLAVLNQIHMKPTVARLWQLAKSSIARVLVLALRLSLPANAIETATASGTVTVIETAVVQTIATADWTEARHANSALTTANDVIAKRNANASIGLVAILVGVGTSSTTVTTLRALLAANADVEEEATPTA